MANITVTNTNQTPRTNVDLKVFTNIQEVILKEEEKKKEMKRKASHNRMKNICQNSPLKSMFSFDYIKNASKSLLSIKITIFPSRQISV